MKTGRLAGMPAFGICGWSGSGKTTVIEKLVRKLSDQGLVVGVIKHDVHGLNIDHEGKDSDRFFKAGGDILMRGPEQTFLRAHKRVETELAEVLKLAWPRYDIVLLEGHKSTPLVDKIWMLSDGESACPDDAANVVRVLKREDDRLGIVSAIIEEQLPVRWQSQPVYAGILIGGESSRMGKAKHLMETDGQTWLKKATDAVAPFVDNTVILGSGQIPDSHADVPVLPDIEDVNGPLAGMLSAMRWQPLASWIFVACDLPNITPEAIRWLLSTRKPGVWATIPQLKDSKGYEPLLAHYDCRSHHLLAAAKCPADIATSPKVVTPPPPDDLVEAWANINTPADLERLGTDR